MIGQDPARRPAPGTPGGDGVAAGCGRVLSGVLLLALASPLSAQDDSPSSALQRAATLLPGVAAPPANPPVGAPVLHATGPAVRPGTRDGAATLPGRGVSLRPGAPSLPRRASALERGWRLVGAGGLLSPSLGPRIDAWPEGPADAEPTGDEAPFLVRLFDARDLMRWLREARAWGEHARRTLFGPRGIVRAGTVPGTDRPRMRLELTDARPGIQIVILTR